MKKTLLISKNLEGILVDIPKDVAFKQCYRTRPIKTKGELYPMVELFIQNNYYLNEVSDRFVGFVTNEEVLKQSVIYTSIDYLVDVIAKELNVN